MLTAGVSLLLVNACSPPPPADKAAANTVKAFYQALKNKDYGAVMNYYADDFFKNQSKDAWLEVLKKRGDLQKVDVGHLQADTRFSGKFYIFQMHTVYSGEPKRETLTLVWSIEDNKLKIVGHMLDQ